jgi:MFS family permease
VDSNYSLAPQAETVGVRRPGLLLKNVYSLYRNEFPRWFGITAPTSPLAAAVLWSADQRIKAIYRSIPPLEMKHHFAEIAGAMIWRFGSFFLSWLLGCFALAAIATVVNRLDDEDVDSVWRHDSHQRAREHFSALVLAALFTFCAFLAGMVVAALVELAAVRVMGWPHFSRFSYGLGLAAYVVVASIVSWFGMTIPIIVRGNIGVWAALKKSVELSNGYEGALFWLVVQSVAGSFVAGYAVYHGLRLFFPAHLRYTLWYGWLVYIAAVLAGAAVEPPIFIGFSLLTDPEQLNVSSLPRS